MRRRTGLTSTSMRPSSVHSGAHPLPAQSSTNDIPSSHSDTERPSKISPCASTRPVSTALGWGADKTGTPVFASPETQKARRPKSSSAPGASATAASVVPVSKRSAAALQGIAAGKAKPPQ